jgi:hypothetical protein
MIGAHTNAAVDPLLRPRVSAVGLVQLRYAAIISDGCG